MSTDPVSRAARPLPGEDRFARIVALCALLATAACLVYVAGAPLQTADLWWHLRMGETYATEGPWPDGDPLLHTAHADAPVQHEWLFDVAVHLVDRSIGFPGLRVVHALIVLGILGFAWSLFRRETDAWSLAALGTLLFAALAAWRLRMFRPDLVSIPAAMATYRLLIENDRLPGGGRIVAAVVLTALWANLHSLFAIGPALLVAALLGLGLREVLRRRIPGADAGGEPAGAAVATRWTLALVAAVLTAALNPRGFAQHATFFHSSEQTAIWKVQDEWLHFDPFRFLPEYGLALPFSGWLLTDGVVLAFFIAAAWAFVRFLRSPSRERLHTADPVLFGLGFAGCVALAVSIRFQWMLLFALLFLVRSARAAWNTHPTGAPWISRALAAGALALLAVYLGWSHAPGPRSLKPAALARYATTHMETGGLAVNGIRFLAESEIEGRLFNSYLMGGALGYWLAPTLRTFIDGRTEHYPPDVLDDYLAVNAKRGARPGERFTRVLDRRGVDVFFGVGLPIARPRSSPEVYTTAHLDGNRDWVLVYRNVDHAIWARAGEAGRANRERAAAWYAGQGIPFDAERGLDVARVVREHPTWAIRERMLPLDWATLLQDLHADDENRRIAARDAVAWFRFLLGDRRAQIALDRQTARAHPRNRSARRRLTASLLEEGRAGEALAAARELVRLDPGDPRARAFERAAAESAVPVTAALRIHAGPARPILPVLLPNEAQRLLEGRIARPR